MNDRLTEITRLFPLQQDLEVIAPFFLKDGAIFGEITLRENDIALSFKVIIYPHYPFQIQGHETIRFINKELVSYNHVNADGSICVHTYHSPELGKKIAMDVNSLRHWIKRYYINKEEDSDYEHIIVPQTGFNNEEHVFLFTEVDHVFKHGEFGYFGYSAIAKGRLKKQGVTTYIVQDFTSNKITVSCKWGSNYKKLQKTDGIFYFADKPPVSDRRFAVKNWMYTDDYFSQPFFSFLYALGKTIKVKNKKEGTPLLIGYKISDTEIHWQTILIPSESFPNYGEKIGGGGGYIGRMYDQQVYWGQTRNCSYSYFFGRGTFDIKITQAKILIIGIGAIGSMVATTLTRGGCLNITLIDHDVKEPENICRSEYFFNSGINDKVDDLGQVLINISPFIEVSVNEDMMDFIKAAINDCDWAKRCEERLNQYDIVFDCSTDNDIAFILNQMDIKAHIFNFSITNQAREFVCAIKPDLYNWLMNLFAKLDSGNSNLYAPTGCWAPTFKASYNDIAIYVQYALKHINACLQCDRPFRPFYLSYPSNYSTEIKIHQF